MGDSTLSEAELLIMAHFWKNGSMKSEEVAAAVSEKNWKNTTLLTFLSRLARKGMLRVQKQGKTNLYIPLVSEAEYKHSESQAFLDELYEGSAKNFFAAMVSSKGLTQQDLAELKEWLQAQEVEPDA